MALLSKDGWIWTPEEKATIRTWKPRVRRQRDKLLEQVRRFREYIPAFTDEAAKIAQPFLDEADTLLYLDGRTHGRKYQKYSPEETSQKLHDLEKLVDSWVEFSKRPDVGAAISAHNKKATAVKRELLKPKTVEKKAGELLQDAAKAATMIKSGLKGIEEVDPRVLQRLLLICLIKHITWFHQRRRDAIRKLVTADPPPTMMTVLKYALRYVLQDSSRRGISADHLIALYLSTAADDLISILEECKEKGRPVQEIDKEKFLIYETDYSLKAIPE